jgi:hypothetical protein
MVGKKINERVMALKVIKGLTITLLLLEYCLNIA